MRRPRKVPADSVQLERVTAQGWRVRHWSGASAPPCNAIVTASTFPPELAEQLARVAAAWLSNFYGVPVVETKRDALGIIVVSTTPPQSLAPSPQSPER